MSAKHFIEFLDIARRVGIMREDDITKTTPEEWDLFEQCRPFVSLGSMSNSDKWVSVDDQKRIREVDAPFPIFSIECTDAFAFTNTYKKSSIIIPILCAVIIESEPRKYTGYTLEELNGQKGVFEVSAHKAMAMADAFCKKIPQCKMGREVIRQNVKIGTGKYKRTHKIKHVIHIMPRTCFKLNPSDTRKIDWSHRFEVRGHWRKINSIGKDREGEYCIDGFTWVRHHIRGEENLPLIRKTREVEFSIGI